MKDVKQHWELEKEQILLKKKKQRLFESLSTQPSRKGWTDRGSEFKEGNYFIHPSTGQLWVAVGPYSPTWGTEVQIYSQTLGTQLKEWDDQLQVSLSEGHIVN